MGAGAAKRCGFCGGVAVWDQARLAWVHADAGARVRPGGPGDFVSARHNEAGSVVLTVDLVDDDDDPCPCGRAHTRGEHGYDPDAEPADTDPADELDGDE